MNYSPYFQGTSPPAIPPQMPYSNQWGYPQQQPSQSDFIDQATKILNFVEALQQRGKAPQQDIQGQPTQYSTSNFQTQPTQAIGAQEQRLAQLVSPALREGFPPQATGEPVRATSTPQSSPYTQTSLQPNNNLEASLQQQVQVLAQGLQAAIQERDMAFKIIESVLPFIQVNQLLNQEINELDRTVAGLIPFVRVAQIWMQDALAHEQVLNNVLSLIQDPEFLVYHAFNVWSDRIQHNGQGALEWISDEYLNLIDAYERKYIAVNGQHSPMWQRMQPATIAPVMGSPIPQQQYQAPPMPPIPGGNGIGSPIDQLKQRIELMKSGIPDLGQQMQRIHAAQRQSMNVDVLI